MAVCRESGLNAMRRGCRRFRPSFILHGYGPAPQHQTPHIHQEQQQGGSSDRCSMRRHERLGWPLLLSLLAGPACLAHNQAAPHGEERLIGGWMCCITASAAAAAGQHATRALQLPPPPPRPARPAAAPVAPPPPHGAGWLGETYQPGQQPATGDPADPAGMRVVSWDPRIFHVRKFLTDGASMALCGCDVAVGLWPWLCMWLSVHVCACACASVGGSGRGGRAG